jgi:hypothetical protein
METQLLRAPEIFPSQDVLKAVLGKVYSVLEEFETQAAKDEYALTIEWRYYNDGKSWLGKVCHKKKTVFWLSVWDGFFKTSFFFMEKHREEIAALDISPKIKEDFNSIKPVGKLIPMIINISKKEQLADLLKVVKFKKGLK